MRERQRVPLGMARIRWRGCTLRLDTEGRERENVVHGRGLWFRLVLWEQAELPSSPRGRFNFSHHTSCLSSGLSLHISSWLAWLGTEGKGTTVRVLRRLWGGGGLLMEVLFHLK